ncbi:hypothetical protein [Actinoplanes palleronii]|uniref:Uncharacterized protein n=1 Tax=Actinoplanes palleronii TaxID=113570 RepID=A0ABQ4BE33_9ACTN|nr:hypothetical protein [Actinoplanes palleronii]GIE68947.1 hypothetical protein Apa02nite_050550 [Actinoplanes palleronii]
MRRSVLYTAGLMIAGGASLLFAGPAAAAPSTTASFCCSYPSYSSSNYQYLGQSNYTNQTTLNNVGNPQLGLINFNGGGSAGSSNYTSQFGGISNGW